MFVLLHQLSLPVMFATVLAICLVITWIVIGIVRFAIAKGGYAADEALPIRESIVGACTTIFALMVAFSAAGLWADSLAARSAAQQEADAVENVLVLASGLPADLQTSVRDSLKAYVAQVVSSDWPAMADGESIESPVFDRSGDILIKTIGLVSRQNETGASPAAYTPVVNQLLAVRHARLLRLSASNTGMSWAQWIAIWIISTMTVTAIAICNNHVFRMQILATHIFVVVVTAAYFVILAHDRPFMGQIAVQPAAFLSISAN
ncbi:bestrophin-like domain [Labrys neptuniae]